MARPIANDGVGWNWFDKLMLWLLPPFLAYVGASVAEGGITRLVVMVFGLTAGIAVVRGIEAAHDVGRYRSPAPDDAP